MRKNHNKLYYGRYRNKTVFKMPSSLMFYPTTDQYLTKLKQKFKSYGFNCNKFSKVVKYSDIYYKYIRGKFTNKCFERRRKL